MNLIANARDVMSAGEVLTLAAADVVLEEPIQARQDTIPPGIYVTPSVSDTGLGLGTVYGIVKKSSSQITVRSGPASGTPLTIYLPRIEERVSGASGPEVTEAARNGTETVLLVEDEDAVRGITAKALLRAGHCVVMAASTDEAIEASERHKGPVHLVLTGVVRPGKLSSKEVLERIVAEGEFSTSLDSQSSALPSIHTLFD